MLASPGLCVYVTEVNSESLKTVKPSLRVSWNQSLQVTPAECLKISGETKKHSSNEGRGQQKDINERNRQDGGSHSRFPVQLWKYSCATMP